MLRVAATLPETCAAHAAVDSGGASGRGRSPAAAFGAWGRGEQPVRDRQAIVGGKRRGWRRTAVGRIESKIAGGVDEDSAARVQ